MAHAVGVRCPTVFMVSDTISIGHQQPPNAPITMLVATQIPIVFSSPVISDPISTPIDAATQQNNPAVRIMRGRGNGERVRQGDSGPDFENGGWRHGGFGDAGTGFGTGAAPTPAWRVVLRPGRGQLFGTA
jgi:hypothetical protein